MLFIRRKHYRHHFWHQASCSISISWFVVILTACIILHCSEYSHVDALSDGSVRVPRRLGSLHRQRRQAFSQEIAVSDNAIISDTTNNNDFNCPQQCTCSDSKNVNGKTSSSTWKGQPFLIVVCSSRNLTTVPEGLPSNARRLDLSGNNLTWIGPFSFAGLNNLQELILSSNLIDEVDSSALNNLVSLKELSLSRNQMRQFPIEAIRSQRALGLLNLEYNKIRTLEANLFPKSSKLFALLLGHNQIENIDENAFNSLSSLQILELNDNKLSEVPAALKKLPSLEELTLANNRLLSIDYPFYELIPKIILLEIRGNPLQWIHPEGFTHLQHLKKLILSDVRNLTEFPHLNGTYSLEILRIDRCSLQSIPKDICSQTPKLKSLDLKSNKIQQIPQLSDCQFLKVLDLSSNYIQDLGDEGVQFAALAKLHVLHLAQNRVNQINAESFYGLEQLQTLDLSYNNIQDIHAEAFVPLTKLVDLNLGNNFFSKLPSIGLDGIVHLKTFNNPNLREFPGPDSFPHVRTLVLSYAYHCCQFNAKSLSVFGASRESDGGGNFGFDGSSLESPALQEDVIYPTDKDDFNSALSNLNLTDVWAGFENFSDRGILAQDFINSFSIDPHGPEVTGLDDNVDILNRGPNHGHYPHRNHQRIIQCIPQPGPFLPCNDLFDWWTLRCGVWIVFLLALMGNGTVVFVLIFSRTKLDVPRFLVCNLAIADLFMGIYLGFLAVVDAATLGEFRKYAIPWQFSSACQMAGFFGVLSSELSVYTLAVITMERHYAITHAMHLNKRLSLRHATYIMAVGWTFSLVMAILPLFGVSDYRKFAVCLPFETSDTISLSYVVFLMFANGVAFTILMGCYLKMYCSIRGSQAWNSNDTRIAKRMALLVFTDLLCWAPIAFFSLTAIFGLQLVSLEEAKVFTVFILPFNSCCNPFLYAILTKQFKKDCVLICKAIEESRVTRGIGRCRNSSNFSNRQTAPNTGSLGEKSSRDGQPCICHSGLHPMGDVNGNAKYRFLPTPEGWSRFGPLGRFVSRFIFCQNSNKDSRQARDDYRMRNVRRYLYTTANVANFPPDAEKHQRHASVSSDNFSSSRSDSWKAQGRCGIPLRLLEPRRRNSWAVTRKPSQDSSLSNSRNDSSATSNSTATWRLSRSSVSSDATNHSGGGKSSLKKAPTSTIAIPTTSSASALTEANVLLQSSGSNVVALENSHVCPAGMSARGHSPIMGLKLGGSALALSSATTAAIPTGAGGNINIKRPKTLQFNEEAIQEFPISPNNNHSHKKKESTSASNSGNKNKNAKPKKDKKQTNARRNSNSNQSDSDDAIIEDDEPSEKIATNRPRLVRQSAFFSDEVVIEPEVCPVHGSLVPGTYDDENEDDDGLVSDIAEDEEEEDDDEENVRSPILRKPLQPGGPYVIVETRQPLHIASTSAASAPYIPYNSSLAIAARRLSTISSRDTVSLQSIKEDSSSASASIAGSVPQESGIPMETFSKEETPTPLQRTEMTTPSSEHC